MGTTTTADLIKDDLIADIQAANPTVDVVKGPVYDLLLRPVAPVLGNVSDSVFALTNLYSPLVSPEGDNDAIINTLGKAFRVPKPTGKHARGVIVFWFNSVPGTTITIPAGTAVSTTDRSVIYVTVSAIVISPTTAYRYYNAGTSRYEISVAVTASIAGTGQSIPQQRLITLLSRIDGISGVYNPEATIDGADAGSTDSYLAQIQRRFLGIDSASFARQDELIVAAYPDAVTNYVLSTDYDSFRRPVRGDAFDCIVQLPSPVQATDVFNAARDSKYTVTGSLFLLTKQPVLPDTVTAVYVNGVVLDTAAYEIVFDTEPATRYSTRSLTGIRVLSQKLKLKNTDTVAVAYSYCGTCYGIQSNVFRSSNGTDFFGADGLVRLAETVPVTVAVTVRSSTGIGSDSLSGFNSATMQTISTAVSDFFSSSAFAETLLPEQLIAYLSTRFTNIRQLQITRFRRIDNYAAEIEAISLRRYEIPAASAGDVLVTQA